jgi:hypothetical protein
MLRPAASTGGPSIVLFVNARDESHLHEWVVHHLLLGFTGIVIFDHMSIVPIASVIQHPRVTVIRISDDDFTTNSMKTELMDRAVGHAREHGVDWLMYLDADEFLVLPQLSSVQALVRSGLQRAPGCDQFTLNWLMFGSAYKDVDDPQATMVSQYTRSEGAFFHLVKSLVRVAAVAGPSVNPHFFTTHGSKPFNLTFHDHVTETHCEGAQHGFYAFFKPGPASSPPPPPTSSTSVATFPSHSLESVQPPPSAYIAHYVYQAYDAYLRRKVNLPRDDDTSKFRDVMPREEFHAQYNAIANDAVNRRYSARIKKNLGFVNARSPALRM